MKMSFCIGNLRFASILGSVWWQAADEISVRYTRFFNKIDSFLLNRSLRNEFKTKHPSCSATESSI